MRFQSPVACAGLPCGLRQKNILSQHYPWNFCRNRNVPPLGKLYRDIRRPLLRPKPGSTPNPVATQGRKIPVVIEMTSVTTQPTQYAWELCCDTEILHRARKLCHARIPTAYACLSRAPRLGRAPSLRTMSRPRTIVAT